MSVRCGFDVTMIKIHEAWTHREWRQSEFKVNHMVILTIDHCSTRCFIRSSRDSWHRVCRLNALKVNARPTPLCSLTNLVLAWVDEDVAAGVKRA